MLSKQLKKEFEQSKQIFEEMVKNCKTECQGSFAINKYKDDLDCIIKQIEKFEELHTNAKPPYPLMIDEVAAAWVASTRVTLWQELGNEFGGYKTGRILAYILDVINEKIEESTAATIKVDAPLYEQCPIINSSDFRVATTEELLKKSKEIFDIITEKLKELDREDK